MLQPENSQNFQDSHDENTKRASGFTPGKRRALGELTNSPCLLSPGGNQLLSPGNSSNFQTLTPSKLLSLHSLPSPSVITPTANLKLLTNLAVMTASGSQSSGHTSARQTLQFEDEAPSRERKEPLCWKGDRNIRNETLSVSEMLPVRPSPHKDHSYGSHQLVPCNVDIEVIDETGGDSQVYLFNKGNSDNLVKEEQDIKKEAIPGLGPRSLSLPAQLPPLPQESQLFAPPPERGNRKEKSLGLLAERMLAMFPLQEGGTTVEVQLDDTAKNLNTERRRIYDVVNVFEALQIMSKVGKNVYQWHGRTYLIQSLAWLRQLASKLGMAEQYKFAKDQELAAIIEDAKRGRDNDIENVSPMASPMASPMSSATMSPMLSPMVSPMMSPGMSPYYSPNDQGGTSLGINTQKFVMLFLVAPEPKTINLEFATRVIHGPGQMEKQKLTRIRRLYDIANILNSLGLIRKVTVNGGRGKKPAFQYVGPEVDNVEVTDAEKRSMPSARQKNSLLAVGRSLVQLPDNPEEAGASNKRARSLSGGRGSSSKLIRTKSVDSLSHPELFAQVIGSGPSLFDLSAVCEMERERIKAGKEATASTENNGEMKPPFPSPVRPPSRKKVLLQRYYSDSALHADSPARQAYTFNSPSSVPHSPTIPSPLIKSSPAPQVVPEFTRHAPLVSPRNASIVSPRRAPIRSPVTPRDCRNSAILPPQSPYHRTIHCSPMGPVGRSLLTSPRSPMDLTTRTSRIGRSPLASRSLNLPPSPLPSAKTSLNLPSSPILPGAKISPKNTPTVVKMSPTHTYPHPAPSAKKSPTIKLSPVLPPVRKSPSTIKLSPVSLLKPTDRLDHSSPLLRAYLANNKNRIFKPIEAQADASSPMTTTSNAPSTASSSNGSRSSVSIFSSPSHATSFPSNRSKASTSVSIFPSSAKPSPTVTITPSSASPDSSTNSSSASELDGIFGSCLPRPKPPPITVPSGIKTPLDFRGLLETPDHTSYLTSKSQNLITLNQNLITPTLNLTTPTQNLNTPSNFITPTQTLNTPTNLMTPSRLMSTPSMSVLITPVMDNEQV